MPLRTIRLSMIAGILAFGAATWLLRRNGGTPIASVGPELLLTIGKFVWGAAVLGCFVLFVRLRQVRTESQYRSLSIVGWALCEATAIYGGVFYLLTGSAYWYQMGVAFMVLSFFAFMGEPPLRRTPRS
ncbi:MAG: hypothetical protein MNPFHGCM_02019 [Gemmatimonadaceae bacterium]|nr:hypothetical protein [Gemmatimonadaceae bacterium]